MRDKNAIDDDETETNSDETGWRDAEFSDSSTEKSESDSELRESMKTAFSEPVPLSEDSVEARNELLREDVRKGDASAAEALRFNDDDGDDLEGRIEDAGQEELLRVLVEEVRANREALEVLAAGDEGKDDHPWTL